MDPGSQAKLDRFIGYYEPYANSHDTLDADKNMQVEVRNVASAVAQTVDAMRKGTLSQSDTSLVKLRPK